VYKKIHRIILIGLLASIPAIGMASFVDYDDDGESNLDAYLGLSFKYNRITPVDHWSRVLIANHPGYDVYVGGYINECWSVDVGYDWTDHKTKSTNFTAGDSLLGVTNTGGVLSSVKGRVRIKASHFDINYFVPSKKRPYSFIFSLGLAVVKPSLNLIWTPGVLTAADNNFNVKGRTTVYPRLGVGIQSMFTDSIGFRAMARWENSNQIRGRFGAAELPDYRYIFHNGVSFSIGLLFKV
jgi:hypothetical protein